MAHEVVRPAPGSESGFDRAYWHLASRPPPADAGSGIAPSAPAPSSFPIRTSTVPPSTVVAREAREEREQQNEEATDDAQAPTKPFVLKCGAPGEWPLLFHDGLCYVLDPDMTFKHPKAGTLPIPWSSLPLDGAAPPVLPVVSLPAGPLPPLPHVIAGTTLAPASGATAAPCSPTHVPQLATLPPEARLEERRSEQDTQEQDSAGIDLCPPAEERVRARGDGRALFPVQTEAMPRDRPVVQPADMAPDLASGAPSGEDPQSKRARRVTLHGVGNGETLLDVKQEFARRGGIVQEKGRKRPWKRRPSDKFGVFQCLTLQSAEAARHLAGTWIPRPGGHHWEVREYHSSRGQRAGNGHQRRADGGGRPGAGRRRGRRRGRGRDRRRRARGVEHVGLAPPATRVWPLSERDEFGY